MATDASPPISWRSWIATIKATSALYPAWIKISIVMPNLCYTMNDGTLASNAVAANIDIAVSHKPQTEIGTTFNPM